MNYMRNTEGHLQPHKMKVIIIIIIIIIIVLLLKMALKDVNSRLQPNTSDPLKL